MDMWAKAAAPRGSGEERAFTGPTEYQAVLKRRYPISVLPIDGQGCATAASNRSSARVQRGHRAVGEPLGQPMFRSATAEELRARVDYYLDIVERRWAAMSWK